MRRIWWEKKDNFEKKKLSLINTIKKIIEIKLTTDAKKKLWKFDTRNVDVLDVVTQGKKILDVRSLIER